MNRLRMLTTQSLICLLVIFAQMAGSSAVAEQPRFGIVKLTDIPGRFGLTTVEMSVNGELARLQIDTGAPSLVLSEVFAEKAKIGLQGPEIVNDSAGNSLEARWSAPIVV